MHVVASVQVRLGSTRLPGKVLFPLGDRRILQWVVDRVESAEAIDRTVVAIGDGPENEAIEEYCRRSDVEFVSGPEDDLLARHLAVATETDCDLLVRITGDCPFVPSQEIKRVVTEHCANTARYTTNVIDAMPIGTAVDVIDPSVLEELNQLGDDHPVRRLRESPEEWDVTFTENDNWTHISDTHVAVDTPEDYWTLSDAVEAVGEDPYEVTEWVAER